MVVEPDTTGFPEKLKADLEKYDYKLKIPVDPDMDGFQEKVQAEVDAARGEDVKVPIDPDAGGFREKVAAATEGEKPVDVPVSPDAGGFDAKLAAVVARSRVFVASSGGDIIPVSFELNEGSYARTLAAATALNATLGDTGKAAADAGNAGAAGMRLWGTGIRVTATAMHGLVSGFIELAAVVIPATIAAAAWAAVWAEGAGRVYEHMNALYTATEATGNQLHRTAGQALGLGDALQKAQTAADPQVYQALGGAINAVKGHMGELAQKGTQVGKIFDTFAAKVVVDMSAAGGAGGRLNTLLAGMVPDLTELGQIFGNLGHALLNFASDMPGLAGGMLQFADAVSRVILAISSLPKWLIEGVFALHEFNTWGSVASGMMGRLGGSVTQLSGGFGSYFLVGDRFVGILKNMIGILPSVAFGIAGAAAKVPVLGAAVVGTTEDIDAAKVATMEWIGELSAMETLGLTALAAGIGFLVYKLVIAKTAAQQFEAAMQAGVEKANNFSILRDVGANLSILARNSDQATAAMHRNYTATDQLVSAVGRSGLAYNQQSAAYNQAKMNLETYSAAQVQQIGDASRTVQGAEQIAKAYHLTIPQAMGVAQAAGVNLTKALKTQGGAWTVAGQQVKDYMTGMAAMGTTSGQVGSDMLGVAISSGLAATKVDAVNQALDQFMANVTGGQAGVAGFVTSLKNIGQVAGTTTNNLGTATGSMSLSVKQFASAIESGTVKGAGAWTNFTQIMGSTLPQLADWFRTAGAEGAISGPKASQAILDMVAPMMKFAGTSKQAQSDLVAFAYAQGINVKTFPQLKSAIKDSGATVDGLNKSVSATSIALGNMAKIAQNLGNVMSGQVTAAISNAELHTSGFYHAVTELTIAQQKGSAEGHTAAYWAQKVADTYNAASAAGQKAAGGIGKAGDSAATAGGKMHAAAMDAKLLHDWMAQLHSKTIAITVDIAQHGGLSMPGTGSRLTMPGGATGGVIPGYAPGRDSVHAVLSPGEGILVPEAVKALGPEFVHAANAKFGGARVTRGNKTGHYAGGGITASAHFGFPQDVFNINVADSFTAYGALGGELKSGATTSAMEKAGKTLANAFADGTLTTASAIRSEVTQAVSDLRQYYSGPANARLITAIRAQGAAMEKLATASAKVSATITAMKSFAKNETTSLQSFSALSAITGTANATTGTTATPTGAQIAAGLGKDLGQLHKFFAVIKSLQKAKLSKNLIEQVISMGPPSGTQYGEAILAGGASLIAELNKDERWIGDDERKIGQAAADVQFGQKIEGGFLGALEKDKAKLRKHMDDLGAEIAKEFAKALGVPLRDVRGYTGTGGGSHHTAHHKAAGHHTVPSVIINLNGSKGRLSHEEIVGITHEVAKQLALA